MGFKVSIIEKFVGEQLEYFRIERLNTKVKWEFNIL